MTWRDLKLVYGGGEEIFLDDYFTNIFKQTSPLHENIQAMVSHLISLRGAVLVCEFSILSILPELDICISFLESRTACVLEGLSSSFQVLEQNFYEQYGRCGLVLEQLDEYFIDVLVSNDQSQWNIMNRGYDWKLIERNSQYVFVTPKLFSGKEYFFKLVIISKHNTWLYYDMGELYPQTILTTGELPLVSEEHVNSVVDGCVLASLHPNMHHLKFENYPLFHIGCKIVKSPSFHYELSPMLQVIVEACIIKKYEDPVWREITMIGNELNPDQLKASAIDPKAGHKARLIIACKFDRFRHGNILPKSNPVTVPSSLMMWSEIPHVGELSMGYDTLLRVTSKTPIFFVFLPQDDYSKLYDFGVQVRLKNSNELEWITLDMETAVDAFHLQKMSANIVKCSPKSNHLLEYGKNYSVRITVSYNNCKPVVVKEFSKTIPKFNYITDLTTDILERNGGLLIFNSGTYFVYLMLNGTIMMIDPNVQYQWNETRMFTGNFTFSNMISENEIRKFFLQSMLNDNLMQDDNNIFENQEIDVTQWKYITSVETTFDHNPPQNLRLPKKTYNYCFHIFFDGHYKKYRLIETSQLFSDVENICSFNWRNEDFTNVILMDYYSHCRQSDEKRSCGLNKSNEYPQRVIQWFSNFYIHNSRQLCDLIFDFTS